MEKQNKKINNRILRDIWNVFILEKENEAIKDIILKDIINLFENQEEKNYYKPVRVSNFWNDNFINTKYKRNGDSCKTLSVEEYNF